MGLFIESLRPPVGSRDFHPTMRTGQDLGATRPRDLGFFPYGRSGRLGDMGAAGADKPRWRTFIERFPGRFRVLGHDVCGG